MTIIKGVINTVGDIARAIRMDPLSNILTTITFEHAQIHDGDTWRIRDFVELTGSGSIDDFLFRTPATPTDKWVHLNWVNLVSESEFQADFYRAPTVTADGIGKEPFNANDNYAGDPPLLDVFTGPTISAPGTRLAGLKLGAGGSTPGTARDQNEFVLRVDTTYLLRITKSTSGTDYLSYNFSWYETTNKNDPFG